MPELAEVEYYRKQWNPGVGCRVERVHLHAGKRVFRDTDTNLLTGTLPGKRLLESRAHGKTMLFIFAEDVYLTIHLGMAGRLRPSVKEHLPEKHDHFVLYTEKNALVFNDYRLFGRVMLDVGTEPDWWRNRAPGVLDDTLDRAAVKAFLARHAKAPVKAVLLDQTRFPGIGNWMADEILWRARIHPACPSGAISPQKVTALFTQIKAVARDAMEVIIGTDWSDPPEHWLFNHRWRDHGTCPDSGKPLKRATIGGRTTCWSPALQRLPRKATGCLRKTVTQ